MADDNRRRQVPNKERVQPEFTENLVCLNRVSKVLKGGRRFSFSALVVIGNRKGQVGYGFGKAGDVSEAIRKAVQSAHKNIITVEKNKTTVPHWVEGKFDKARILFKPAAKGTGIIAGGPVRIVLEMAGYLDVLSKSLGSRNSINMVKATFDGLHNMHSAREIAASRGKSLKELWS